MRAASGWIQGAAAARRPGLATGLASLLALTLVLAVPGRARDGEQRAAAQAYQAHVQEVIARVVSTVVTVGVPGEEGDPDALGLPRGVQVRSGGSGVIVSAARALVLTCEHVTEGKDRVLVGLADGRTLEAQVLGRDAVGDVALLRVLGGGAGLVALGEAAFGDSEALRVGDPVLALGNPFGLAREDHQAAASFGVVSALHRYQGGSKVYGDALQIDAAVNPGSSGGPLFDLSGRLVGLNGRISVRGQQRHNVGVGFAVPIHQVALVLDDLEAGRDMARGYLGVRFSTQRDDEQGARLSTVQPGSPAAAAGLLPGDRILAVQGRPLEHPIRLQNYLSVLPAGTRVTLTVQRDARRLELAVTLDARRDVAPR